MSPARDRMLDNSSVLRYKRGPSLRIGMMCGVCMWVGVGVCVDVSVLMCVGVGMLCVLVCGYVC